MMTSVGIGQQAQKLLKEIKAQPELLTFTGNDYAGVLSKESIYSFSYDMSKKDELQQVALGLAVRHSSYSSGDLFSIFAMNEPEGYLRFYIEQALIKYRIPNKLFFLALSQDTQIGRINYKHKNIELEDLKPESLNALIEESSPHYFDNLLSRFALRSGLSGAQPKVLVPIESSKQWDKATVFTPSYIVKDAGFEFPGLSLNEYFCMSVAKSAGLDVPKFWLSNDGLRFIIDRFDRIDHKQLAFEDMTVLQGVSAAKKYFGSYESIMRTAKLYCKDKANAGERLFERIALSAILRDGDAHLKNFGLLYDDISNVYPAPVFDVVCTAIYPDHVDYELALKMHKSRSFPDVQNLIQFAKNCGINGDFAIKTIEKILLAINIQLDQCENDPRYINDKHHTLQKLLDIFRPYGLRPNWV